VPAEEHAVPTETQPIEQSIPHSVKRASHRAGRADAPKRLHLAVLGLLGAVAVLAIACGSSKSSGYGAAPTTSTTATAAAGANTTVAAAGSTSVKVATTSLGPVVVDSKGLTLYFFKNDTGSASTCSGGCATAWPAATVTGTPNASSDVTAPLTTTTRADGSVQLVLGGHPLYRFSGDAKAGDVTGQGVGNVWYAAGADGKPVG
jgi:predicted lipoprotein with Yx(FWY)xxD motif